VVAKRDLRCHHGTQQCGQDDSANVSVGPSIHVYTSIGDVPDLKQVAENQRKDFPGLRGARQAAPPILVVGTERAQTRITFSACRPLGPCLTSNSTSEPSSRVR
jgi:hypothetical protein